MRLLVLTLMLLALPALPLGAQQQPAPQPPPAEVPEPVQDPVQREEARPIQPELQTPGELPEQLSPDEGDEYRGPTILSRGGLPTVTTSEALLQIRPFVTVEGIYDSSLATVSVDERGQLPETDAYGVQAMFGANGIHSWRRSNVVLDYRGSYRKYSRETFYDGSDHSATVGYENRLSRRWTVALSGAGATFRRGFFLPSGLTQMYDPTFQHLTGAELFDSRANAGFGSGQLIRNHTPRLSFSMGASGFIVRRSSSALFGVVGFTATGDTAYRLTRYSTVAVDYSFARYEFQRQFGSSDLHSIGLNYSTRIGRYWEIGLRFGGYRVQTSRLIRVELDPVIAELLGTSTGVQAFEGSTYLPHYRFHISRGFRRSNLHASYERIVTAGNGLLATSGAESVTANYTNQTTRRVSLNLHAGWIRYRALSQTLGMYRSYYGGGGFSVRMPADLSLVVRTDARNQIISGTSLDRLAYRATVGIGWSPGDFPLSIW